MQIFVISLTCTQSSAI